MIGMSASMTAWWLPCLIIGAAVFLFVCLKRRHRRVSGSVMESGLALDAVAVGGDDPRSNGTAQMLNQFFGAATTEAVGSPAPPPRLTVHPLAQIIAQARAEKPTATVAVNGNHGSTPDRAAPAKEQVHEPAAADVMHGKLATMDAELERVRADLAGMTARFKALDKESFIYTAYNKQLEAEIATLKAGLVPPDAPSQADLEKLRAELAAANTRLQQAQTENKKLAEKTRAAAAMATELASARRDLAAAEELLRATESPANHAPVEKPPSGETAHLVKELESLRSENADLRAKIARERVEPANLGVAPAGVVSESVPLPREVQTVGKFSNGNGVAPHADDLTKIKGIATVINRKLNEHGIISYRQIALWRDDEVNEFSGLLGVKNRITRDQWREQARELHAAKHGDALPGL